jgi:hypothetical protein
MAKWGELINGVRNYPLHRGQQELYNSTARITAGFCGTGSGKSACIPLWLIKQIITNKYVGRHLVVLPTYKMIKQSTVLDQFRLALEGTSLFGRFNEQKHIYTTAQGAEIYFRSADDPNSLESGQYLSLIIDECAKINYRAWVNASARVGQRSGPILLVSTPDINNWCYEEVFKLCTETIIKDNVNIRYSPDKKIKVVQFGSILNPTYSKEEIERQKRILPEALFKRRYLGEFASLEGLVYSKYQTAILEEEVPQILPSPAIHVVGGIDWGWNDPAVILIGAECQDNRLYILEEFYGSKIPIDELAIKVKQLQDKWGVSMFFCDSSRPEIIDMLQRRSINCQSKNVPGIETGIALVDARINSDMLKIYQNCRYLIDELSKYQRMSKKDGNYDEKPKDKENHSCLSGNSLITTNKGFIKIKDIKIGDMALTRNGYKKVLDKQLTQKNAITYNLKLSNGLELNATKYHKIFVENSGFLSIDTIRYGDSIYTGENLCYMKNKNTTVKFIVDILWQKIVQIETILRTKQNIYIEKSGQILMAKYLKDIIYIIKMKLLPIMKYLTLYWLHQKNITKYTLLKKEEKKVRSILKSLKNLLKRGTHQKKVENGTQNIQLNVQKKYHISNLNVLYAVKNIKQNKVCCINQDFVVSTARCKIGETLKKIQKLENALFAIKNIQQINIQYQKPVHSNVVIKIIKNLKKEDVYNLTIEEEHEYFANNILVKNCDSLRYMCGGLDFGKHVSYKVNKEEKEQKKLEAGIRTGKVSPDINVRKKEEANKLQKQIDEHFSMLVNAEDDYRD